MRSLRSTVLGQEGDDNLRASRALDVNAAFQLMHDFAKAYTEDLIVIHAAPSVEFGATYGDWFPMDAREALVCGARERVDALIEKVGCKAEIHVECADTLRFVRWAADESYADVLVIGRSPREGVLGRLRTHVYGIIREAPCPVISV